MQVLEAIGGRGVQRLGTDAHRGKPYDEIDLTDRSRSCSATRPTACPPRSPTCSTAGCTCRWRATSSRSTWRWPDRSSASTPLANAEVRREFVRHAAPTRSCVSMPTGESSKPTRPQAASLVISPRRSAGQSLTDVFAPRGARRQPDPRRGLASVEPLAFGRRHPRARGDDPGAGGDLKVRVTGPLRTQRRRVDHRCRALHPSAATKRERRADRQRSGVHGESRAAQPAHVGEGLHLAAAQPLGSPQGRPEAHDARAGASRRRPRHAAHHRAARHQPARDRSARVASPAHERRRARAARRREADDDVPGPRVRRAVRRRLPAGVRRPRQARAGAHEPRRERGQVREHDGHDRRREGPTTRSRSR